MRLFFYLANSTKICYTYDSLDRVTKRTVYNECDEVVSEENYTYDAAGNITDAPNSCFGYDTNNRLTVFNGNNVTYDLDGNMLNNGSISFEYDSANRLIKAGDHAYTYNAEDVRIKNLCDGYETTYTYNTNCKLSQLLMKNTNGIVTKYVYGKGLIGEQKCDEGFKTYHFDYRGSTVAITDQSGNITDTFKYDTYGNLVSRTGSSFVIFQYTGRDGVVTDKNGLIYMRARYYSPAMRRFVNVDIIPGEISNAVTLNRYAYANGNPVSNVDPFGLSAEREKIDEIAESKDLSFAHAQIIYFAQQWKNYPEVKWTTWDIAKWKTFGGDKYLFDKKSSYISNYKDIINDAASKYDIPVFLLAGIMYTEFGGDPMWIDDVAYSVRAFDWSGPDWVDENLTITKNPNLTSFGNTSIQVRRAIEMLDYDANSAPKSAIIDSLKDPIQNIYMAARHLQVLKEVDFSNKSSDDLTDEDIQTIASRYNLGPDCSFEKAQGWSYGKSIINNKDDILDALS